MKHKKLLFIPLAVALLFLFSVSSFAMPSYNSPLLYPLQSVSVTLGETLTGVATGKYYIVPDAFSVSVAGVTSGQLVPPTNTQTFTNNGYRGQLANSSWSTQGKVFSQYSQIFNVTSDLDGSLLCVPLDSYQTMPPLYSGTDIYLSNSSDIAIQTNYQTATNTEKFLYSARVEGYSSSDGLGDYIQTGEISVSDGWETDMKISTFLLSQLVSDLRSRTDISVEFGGIIHIKQFDVWFCDENVSVIGNQSMRKLNYLQCGSNGFVTSDSELLYNDSTTYKNAFYVFLNGEIGSAPSFIGSNWISWAIGAVEGVMNVKIFGDQVNFTLGGLLASVISISFLTVILKIFNR